MIKNKLFVGESGGGIVKVYVDANLNIIKVNIDNNVFAKSYPKVIGDLNFMADLFKSATNSALEKCMSNKVEALTNTFSGIGNFYGK